MNEESST
jgi:hypothetical protein